MRYTVWFTDCPANVEFDNLADAKHYAKLNAGNVYDSVAGETIERYAEVWE